MAEYDAIVVGLGAMGSATLMQLAKRGLKVLGIDRYSPPHQQGSSHGETRITRLAIGEGSHYTPLVMRSHEIWKEMEDELGRSDLFTRTGLIVISSESTFAQVHVKDFFKTTVDTAEKFKIKHDLLDSDELSRRFPQLTIQKNEAGYYEYDAGFLRPENCIAANLELASRHGATIVRDTKVLRIDDSSTVTVETESSLYRANNAVITAGAWIKDFLNSKQDLFKIYRQVLYWFDVSAAHEMYTKEKFPVFIWEPPGVSRGVYGFPAIDGPSGGLKVSAENLTLSISGPEEIDRSVSKTEISDMHKTYVSPLFKGIPQKCIKSSVCMYTTTSDAGFLIDRLPDSKNIWFASPCSGHGFKHSAAIGEAMAELVIDGKSTIDLTDLSLYRNHLNHLNEY